LLTAWCRAGYSPGEFWDQTPATFQACMTGAIEKAEAEIERDLFLAWHTAAFNAATKTKAGLKPLRQMLRKAQTPSQMAAVIQSLGAKSNMKIRRIGGNDGR
jgi:hypothetical protein